MKRYKRRQNFCKSTSKASSRIGNNWETGSVTRIRYILGYIYIQSVKVSSVPYTRTRAHAGRREARRCVRAYGNTRGYGDRGYIWHSSNLSAVLCRLINRLSDYHVPQTLLTIATVRSPHACLNAVLTACARAASFVFQSGSSMHDARRNNDVFFRKVKGIPS